MRSSIKIVIYILLLLLTLPATSHAFWMWTPETGKWINPKYAVKDTPSEQLEHALDIYNAKDYEEAKKEFQKLLKHYPKSKEAPDAQFFVGLCAEQMGNLKEAFDEYQKVIDVYPFSDRSPEVVRHQYNIALSLIDGHNDRNKVWATINPQIEEVVEVFRKVIDNAPYGEHAAPAQYKIGLFLLEKGKYNEAREEFEKLINDYPDSQWVQASKYQIAISDSRRSAGAQYDQKVTNKAVEEFENFVKEHPEADLSDDAKKNIQQLRDKEAENNFVIAEFYLKQDNPKAAKIYFQSIVDEYPNSQWAKKSLIKIREISEKES